MWKIWNNEEDKWRSVPTYCQSSSLKKYLRLAKKSSGPKLDQSAKQNWLEMGMLSITFYVHTTPSGQLAVKVWVPWTILQLLKMMLTKESGLDCKHIGCSKQYIWRDAWASGNWNEASHLFVCQRPPQHGKPWEQCKCNTISINIQTSKFGNWSRWFPNGTSII